MTCTLPANTVITFTTIQGIISQQSALIVSRLPTITACFLMTEVLHICDMNWPRSMEQDAAKVK